MYPGYKVTSHFVNMWHQDLVAKLVYCAQYEMLEEAAEVMAWLMFMLDIGSEIDHYVVS